MDFMTCVKERRSIRRFKDQKVDHALFEKIVEAASYSPSWKNTQIARYIVVEDRALIDYIADNGVMDYAHNAEIMRNAPALVLVTYICGRSGYERDGSFTTSKKDQWEMFDTGIATQTFCLAAHSLGVGTVIMGIFDDEKVAKAAGIPEGQKLGAIIAAGYPDETPTMPKRKTVAELLSYR